MYVTLYIAVIEKFEDKISENSSKINLSNNHTNERYTITNSSKKRDETHEKMNDLIKNNNKSCKTPDSSKNKTKDDYNNIKLENNNLRNLFENERVFSYLI